MIQAELSSLLPFTDEETRALKVFPRSPTSRGQNMNVTQFRVPWLRGTPEGLRSPWGLLVFLGKDTFPLTWGNRGDP